MTNTEQRPRKALNVHFGALIIIAVILCGGLFIGSYFIGKSDQVQVVAHNEAIAEDIFGAVSEKVPSIVSVEVGEYQDGLSVGWRVDIEADRTEEFSADELKAILFAADAILPEKNTNISIFAYHANKDQSFNLRASAEIIATNGQLGNWYGSRGNGIVVSRQTLDELR